MKPTQEQVIAWAREAGLPRLEATDEIFCLPSAISLANLAYEAGQESMKWNGIHSCHPDCQRPACVHTRKAVEAEREACAGTQEKYMELLYAVTNKFPDETRHQTALRYIKNAESQTNMQAKEDSNG